MKFDILALTGEQIRAARALSRTEQSELARLAGLSLETIKRLERIRGPVDANARTLRAIQSAFLSLGVYFEGDGGGRTGVVHNATAARPRSAGTGNEGLHRLTYHSRIVRTAGQNLRPTLAYIYSEARILHESLRLTGIIYAREGRLLQALEGDREAVHQAFRAIQSYPQHDDLQLLESGPAERRHFPEFSFCCGLFDGDAERLDQNERFLEDLDPDSLTPESAEDLLLVARDLQAAPPRNARSTPGACPLASRCRDSVCGTGSAPGGVAPPSARVAAKPASGRSAFGP